MSQALILASASPRRRDLIRRLGLPFEVAASDAPETRTLGESPVEMAVRLATLKALAARPERIDSLIVGCDTIVIDGDEVLGKPCSASEAQAMLRRLRGRVHEVVTGLAVVEGNTGRIERGFVSTAIHMRQYGDDEIEAYVASGDPLDKAGAYGVQDERFRPAERVDGCYCNVVGLPVLALAELLGRFGVTSGCQEADCCGYPSSFAQKKCRLMLEPAN